jgi:hypothetical protein
MDLRETGDVLEVLNLGNYFHSANAIPQEDPALVC